MARLAVMTTLLHLLQHPQYPNPEIKKAAPHGGRSLLSSAVLLDAMFLRVLITRKLVTQLADQLVNRMGTGQVARADPRHQQLYSSRRCVKHPHG